MRHDPPPFRKGHKVQVTVILEPEQVKLLDRISNQQKRSRASVLRLAVDTYLALNVLEPERANVA